MIENDYVYVRLGDAVVEVDFALAPGAIREKLTRFLAFDKKKPSSAVTATLDVIAVAGPVHETDRGSRARPKNQTVARGEGWAFWWNREHAQGTAFFDAEREIASWHVACPFRQMFAWMAQTTNSMLVHASAVGVIASGAVLFVGPGGAGKSTLARACVSSGGIDQHGDDWVVVNGLYVGGIYNSVKLSSEMFRALGDDSRYEGRDFIAKGKHVYAPFEMPTGQRLIRAIVVPKIAERGIELRPVSSAEAVFAMAPSTLLQSQGVDGRVLKNIVELCGAVPCYELSVSKKMLPAAGGIVKELCRG